MLHCRGSPEKPQRERAFIHRLLTVVAAEQQQQPLAASEVERLTGEATNGEGRGACEAAKELGMRYLTYGRSLADMNKAIAWLTRATSMLSTTGRDTDADWAADAWYSLGRAYLKADGADEAPVAQTDDTLPENASQEVILEDTQSSTYGAKSGPEFVRIVRTRANKEKGRRDRDRQETRLLLPRLRRAYKPLLTAAEMGHVDAMVQLGNFYYESSDYEPTPIVTAAASEMQSMRRRRQSDTTVVDGGGGGVDGVSQDGGGEDSRTNLGKAVTWYERAIDASKNSQKGEHADAWYNLGSILYDGGKGVPQDIPRAVQCFRRAASLGDASASYWLGHAYRVGEPSAGVEPDQSECVRHLRIACDVRGHPAACYYLAMLHRNGEPALGLPASPSLFRSYLSKAEELGDADALFCLADMYFHGTDGVAADEPTAIEYYRRAGEAGHADALTCLGAILHRKRAYEEAFQAYQQAAEMGNTQAWINLAGMYMLGQGVEKNEHLAKHILKTVKKRSQDADQ